MSVQYHFVGMRGDEYQHAVSVWGECDWYHHVHDARMYQYVADGDVVVYGSSYKYSQYSYDDSAHQ